jgi:hypothetical protein
MNPECCVCGLYVGPRMHRAFDATAVWRHMYTVYTVICHHSLRCVHDVRSALALFLLAYGAALIFVCFRNISLIDGVIVAPKDALMFLKSGLCI